MLLTEKMINTNWYAGRLDIITGIKDFESEAEYNDEWHTYRVNGKIVPSVTQILSEDNEYVGIPIENLEYAIFKGNLVHKEIQEFLEKGKTGFTHEFWEFVKLYEGNQDKFSEKAIFDIKTYNQNDLKKRKKCYNQIKMYDDGYNYLTKNRVDKYYEIWLPHNKKGKIIDLKGEFENEKNR